jgi:hypothetical protein
MHQETHQIFPELNFICCSWKVLEQTYHIKITAPNLSMLGVGESSLTPHLKIMSHSSELVLWRLPRSNLPPKENSVTWHAVDWSRTQQGRQCIPPRRFQDALNMVTPMIRGRHIKAGGAALPAKLFVIRSYGVAGALPRTPGTHRRSGRSGGRRCDNLKGGGGKRG